MKKITPVGMAVFILTTLWAVNTHAQTLVNQYILDTLGHPSVIFQYTKAMPISGTNDVAIMTNTFNPHYSSANDNFYLIKVSRDSGFINGAGYIPAHGGIDFGTNLCVKDGYAYMVGFTTDSVLSHSYLCNLFKINLSTFDTIWTVSSSIDSSIYQQAPFSVLADNAGNVYMGASVQTANSYKAVVIKYDSNGVRLWQSSFDTTGFYTIPVAMALNVTTASLAVTGFSFDSLGNSNFVTVNFSTSTGTRYGYSTSANGRGMISHPVGIIADSSDNSYIAGTSTVAGAASVIKIIGYNPSFGQHWVSTYGDSTQTNTTAAMSMNNVITGVICVTGTVPNTNGGSSLVALKYNTDGSLAWSSKLDAPNPAYAASGVSITNDPNGNTYVTGTVFNGSDSDIIVAELNTSGSILWSKIFSRTLNSNDVPYCIVVNGNSVFVTAKSVTATDSLYITLEYDISGTYIAPDSTSPKQQWAYYENKGQLIDTGTHQANYVHYYTNTANPRLYVTDAVLSYVYESKDSTTDTLQRIDLKLKQSKTGNPVNTSPAYFSSEQISPYLNYYIGGLPSYYEHVNGYERVTAKDIYPNIDWQLYSDSGGLKYYYVVNAGGNPNDIQFKYEGADSVTYDTTGMKIYSRYGVVSQLPFTAWQYTGSTATQVSLTMIPAGSNEFYFVTGTYDNSKALVIRMVQSPIRSSYPSSINNLKWSTYLGGSGGDYAQDIDIDNDHHQYVTGYTQSTNFPTGSGLTFNNSAGNLGSFLTKFDSASVLQYSTFYGGSTHASGTSLNIKHSTNAVAAGIWTLNDGLYQRVYIAGQTPYVDLPCPKSSSFTGGLHDTAYNGGEADGFVALINGFNGSLQQASYVGSNGEDGINTLVIDRNNSRNPNTLYIGGYTMGSNFPFQNTFTGNFYDNQGRGVLMQLDANMNEQWATGFGSHSVFFDGTGGTDSVGCTVNDIKIDNAGNILIVGNSYFTFPTASPYNITLPDTNSFFVATHPNTTTDPPTNAFLAKFTPLNGGTDNKYKLYYFSEYGDYEKDDGEKICANSTGEIYLAGQGQRDYLVRDTSTDYVPFASDGAYISRFSPNGVLLLNGDYGRDTKLTFGDLFCDGYDNVFAFGSTVVNDPVFSLRQQAGWYYDSLTQIKCFLAQIDHYNNLLWSTFYGSSAGLAKTQAGGMCIDGANMYICGMTTSASAGSIFFPLVDNTVSSFYSTYGGNGTLAGDAFVARFNLLDTYPTGVTDISSSYNTIKCYPNPSNGSFIVSIPDFGNGEKTVTLYNYMGQTVYMASTNQTSIVITANEFASGVYIVRAASATKQGAAKIVISK